MYTLIVQNKYGQQLELTHNDAYVIESIQGLDPPEATINTTRNANADGSVFNSSYVNDRQIIITMAINSPAEVNRIQLYKYFKTKHPLRLYYKNQSRDVFIDGYCQKPTIDAFAKKQIAQIVIQCPDPYFKSVNDTITDFSNITPLFEFPFDIENGDPESFSEIVLGEEKDLINNGDVETGAQFYLRARGTVTNPSITNTQTLEYYKLTIGMQEGDEICIDTRKKQKKVTLTRNGVTSNIIGSLDSGSSWFQLLPGDNLFVTGADTLPENLDAYCVITDLYEGV